MADQKDRLKLSADEDYFNELEMENCHLRLADNFLWFEAGIFQHSLRLQTEEIVAILCFLRKAWHSLQENSNDQEMFAQPSSRLKIFLETNEDYFNLLLDSESNVRFIVGSIHISDLPKLITFFWRAVSKKILKK